MRPRALPLLLLLAAAPALAGDAGPETDPFLAALAGKSGPDAVAAPSFDPDAEAFSWTTRPRREIVDALAARLLRGEAKGWFEPGREMPALPAPPSRIPADFDPGKFEVSDRLAAWVPADAAAAFFGSLTEAEDAVEGLAKFLPAALPALCGDPPGGKRDALRRAIDMLLLPTIWRSNPAVRTGTRQIAVVASDPDLRWAPDIALVAEVDDASLVRFHRESTLSWENRGLRHLRVDNLDAVADDGSVRSFFGLEGGVAVWSTTKSLRDRILAAGAGKAPTLLSPDPRAYALARRTFPAAEGGALLVIPDDFLARINDAGFRARRAAALRCEAVRLVLEARGLAKRTVSTIDTIGLSCPLNGELIPATGASCAACSVHGSAVFPVPMGALPAARGGASPVEGDLPSRGALPVAVLWKGRRFTSLPGDILDLPKAEAFANGELQVLVPPGVPGGRLLDAIQPPSGARWTGDMEDRVAARVQALCGSRAGAGRTPGALEALCGLEPRSDAGRTLVVEGGVVHWEGKYEFASLTASLPPERLASRNSDGVLRLGTPYPGEGNGSGGAMRQNWVLPLEWR